jgi:AraC family transcriptional regulator of adaptative response/methylated-DNA-[protein]-cysteine methyltransferase
MTNYERVEKAIGYLSDHYQQQPDLDEVQHAKKLLEKNNSLADVAEETGLSATSRLHDLFVSIEGMTPGEYKNGGEQLTINYSFAESPFGNVIVASTTKGICHLAFATDEQQALAELKDQFRGAAFKQVVDTIQQNALFIFTQDWKNLSRIKLHLKGTAFQLKVWEALLKVPMGDLTTYADVASLVGNPNATRAVGTAIGSNPVAFLIPCHRVIRSTGIFGQYHWGSNRKTAMIGWESAKILAEK